MSSEYIPGEIFLSDLCVPQAPSVATVDARDPNHGRPLSTEIFSHGLEKKQRKEITKDIPKHQNIPGMEI